MIVYFSFRNFRSKTTIAATNEFKNKEYLNALLFSTGMYSTCPAAHLSITAFRPEISGESLSFLIIIIIIMIIIIMIIIMIIIIIIIFFKVGLITIVI